MARAHQRIGLFDVSLNLFVRVYENLSKDHGSVFTRDQTNNKSTHEGLFDCWVAFSALKRNRLAMHFSAPLGSPLSLRLDEYWDSEGDHWVCHSFIDLVEKVSKSHFVAPYVRGGSSRAGSLWAANHAKGSAPANRGTNKRKTSQPSGKGKGKGKQRKGSNKNKGGKGGERGKALSMEFATTVGLTDTKK